MKTKTFHSSALGPLGLGASLLALACGSSSDASTDPGEPEVATEEAAVTVSPPRSGGSDATPVTPTATTPPDVADAEPVVAPTPNCEDDPTLAGCPGAAPVEEEPARDCAGQVISFDEILQSLQRDVLTQDADDRPFTRYLLLTNRFNAGVCTEALAGDRAGMNEILNMLSTETRVEEATAIDADETIYRIDLRDYGWDRQILVNGQAFLDGWDAIVGSNPYAIEFEGDEAAAVIDQTGTTVPFQYADSLVDVASLGNLYYALVGVDVAQTLDDFVLLNLGIDVVANLDQGELIRAGTTRSEVSRQDRLVERHDIEVRAGAFWQSFEFDANGTDQSIFQDPFGFQEDERNAIFTLPNGFLGFIVADADGNVIEESNVLADLTQDDLAARSAVSCATCHASGFLPVVDEVRAVVEGNRTDFNADDFEAVQDVYVDPTEFAEFVELDSELFQRSLNSARVPIGGVDPMSAVFQRFDDDRDLAAIAGDLGITADELGRDLNLLDPSLDIVATATIDRDDFTGLFEASLCVMQSFSQNQPVVANCDDAIAGLGD